MLLTDGACIDTCGSTYSQSMHTVESCHNVSPDDRAVILCVAAPFPNKCGPTNVFAHSPSRIRVHRDGVIITRSPVKHLNRVSCDAVKYSLPDDHFADHRAMRAMPSCGLVLCVLDVKSAQPNVVAPRVSRSVRTLTRFVLFWSVSSMTSRI